MLERDVFPRPTEEAKQKAIDVAFKADGLSEQLRSAGLIGQYDTRKRGAKFVRNKALPSCTR